MADRDNAKGLCFVHIKFHNDQPAGNCVAKYIDEDGKLYELRQSGNKEDDEENSMKDMFVVGVERKEGTEYTTVEKNKFEFKKDGQVSLNEHEFTILHLLSRVHDENYKKNDGVPNGLYLTNMHNFECDGTVCVYLYTNLSVPAKSLEEAVKKAIEENKEAHENYEEAHENYQETVEHFDEQHKNNGIDDSKP